MFYAKQGQGSGLGLGVDGEILAGSSDLFIFCGLFCILVFSLFLDAWCFFIGACTWFICS
jgi:hypothetical protein